MPSDGLTPVVNLHMDFKTAAGTECCLVKLGEVSVSPQGVLHCEGDVIHNDAERLYPNVTFGKGCTVELDLNLLDGSFL